MKYAKYAVITVTEHGSQLAEKLQSAFKSNNIDNKLNILDIYVKKERHTLNTANPTVSNVYEFDRLKDLIADIFYQYQALIFFTSTGIAVRMIAPYIVHKAKDPAIIVLDEQAHFAISLLSGHLGGANELTQKIATILHAQPVITTATDTNNIIAPDAIATKLGLVPYPLTHIKKINSALVQGKTVKYYIEANWNKADFYQEKLAQFGFTATKISGKKLNRSYTPCVFVSPKRRLMTNILVLSPRRLIAGIGCRRNTSVQLIDSAIQNALQMVDSEYKNLPIAKIVSTVVKSDEQGLLEWAQKHNIIPQFYDNEIMRKMIDKYHIVESAFVKQQIGIGNVCEAAILSYNEKAKIILPKTKFEKATVSLAWE